MRERVIKALAFPRYQILESLDSDNCVHGGLYAKGDRGCRECNFAPECEWLYDNDEFAALQQRPIEALVEALEFAMGYVDALTHQWQHDSRHCRCDACTWLRDAQRLFNAVYSGVQ